MISDELEKLRKRTRKNKKQFIKEKYRNIKWKVNVTIENAIENNCYIEINPDYRFMTWLVKRKLEQKGFVCELDKGDEFSIFPNDILKINWEKRK